MGNSQAKEPVSFDSGVRVTSGLVNQLEGRPHSRKGGQLQQYRATSDLTPTLEEEVANLVRRDKELKHALERSKIAGGLLLKNEAEELERVDNYAKQLLEEEYRVPARPEPCTLERDRTLQCYESHQQDPLKCASIVDAYVACAHQAQQEFAR